MAIAGKERGFFRLLRRDLENRSNMAAENKITERAPHRAAHQKRAGECRGNGESSPTAWEINGTEEGSHEPSTGKKRRFSPKKACEVRPIM